VAISSVQLLSSRKSIPRMVSVVKELATSTGNQNVSPAKVISAVEFPHVLSRVPSTATSAGPVHRVNTCPAVFTLSHIVLSSKVMAAHVSTTKLA